MENDRGVPSAASASASASAVSRYSVNTIAGSSIRLRSRASTAVLLSRAVAARPLREVPASTRRSSSTFDRPGLDRSGRGDLIVRINSPSDSSSSGRRSWIAACSSSSRRGARAESRAIARPRPMLESARLRSTIMARRADAAPLALLPRPRPAGCSDRGGRGAQPRRASADAQTAGRADRGPNRPRPRSAGRGAAGRLRRAARCGRATRSASSSPVCGVAVSRTTRRARAPRPSTARRRSRAVAAMCASSTTSRSQIVLSSARLTSGCLMKSREVMTTGLASHGLTSGGSEATARPERRRIDDGRGDREAAAPARRAH